MVQLYPVMSKLVRLLLTFRVEESYNADTITKT